MASVELRPIVRDADLEAVVTVVNRLVHTVRGDQGGRVWLIGDDGNKKAIAGSSAVPSGTVLSANNYPLRIEPTSTNQINALHSDGVTVGLRVQDAGTTIPVIIGNTRFANNVDVDGTLNVDGATTLQSTLVVTGAATFNGAVTLGDAAADVITITGTATVAEILTLIKGLVVDTNTLVVDAVNNKVGILVATPTAPLTVAGQMQVTNTTVPSGGAGIEMGYNTGTGLGSIASFDRTGAVWKNLNINALTLKLGDASGTRIQMDATGIGFFGTAGVAQPAAAAAASDLTSVVTLANSLRTGVRNLGLFS